MKKIIVVYFAVLFAIQTLSSAERKVKKVYGPFLGPQIKNLSKKQGLVNHTQGIHKKAANITQAIYAGENEGLPLPWYALILADYWNCGGALISKRHVISNRYCVLPQLIYQAHVRVVLGAYSDNQTSARAVFELKREDLVVHGVYDDRPYEVALIVLFADVTFNEFIAPIKVWPGGKDWTGYSATFAGMGGYRNELGQKIYPIGLQSKTQKVMSASYCSRTLGDNYYHELNLCTTDENVAGRASFDDKGGPLYIHDENGDPWLIGIIGPSLPTDEWQYRLLPSNHGRLSYFLCWLDAATNFTLNLAEEGFCVDQGKYVGGGGNNEPVAGGGPIGGVGVCGAPEGAAQRTRIKTPLRKFQNKA